MSPRSKTLAQAGFSAIELMIAVTIGVLISGVVATVFITSATTYRVSNSVAELQETGRVAVAAMERDGRMAGFRGCNSNNVLNTGPFVNTISTPTAYNNALDAYVRGYNWMGAGWSPVLDDVPFNIVNGSDVLMLRVPSGPAASVTAVMPNASAAIQLNTTAGLSVGDRIIVADCAQSSGFRITNVAGNMVSHASGALNATDDLQRAFGDDATVVPYTARQYYLGTSSSGIAGETSLWVKDGTNAPQELAENVERFELLFGEDLNADYVADIFRSANTVANFRNVVAVQVHMLTRGTRPNETMTDTSYKFLGATTTPTDRRIRRVYVATIQLRNRVL